MNALDLYGTEAPPTSSEQITVGDLSFTLEGGALRHITDKGIEMLRGIAFLVRDRDWGTLSPALTSRTAITAERRLMTGLSVSATGCVCSKGEQP